MAKSILNIDDDFIFVFSKYTVGADPIVIPNYVKDHFLNNFNRIQLKDKNYTKAAIECSPYSNPYFQDRCLYLIEVELTFQGKSLGGVLHRPDFDENSEIRIELVDSFVHEDDNDFFIKFHLSGQLNWDFKSTFQKKFQNFVEQKGSIWEEAGLQVRVNIRSNPIYVDFLKYDQNGKSIPNKPESSENLRFILETTPNIFTIINNFEPKDVFQKSLRHWQTFNEKNITLKGNYFKHLVSKK